MNKVFIIAEAGINHNGKIELAYKLIDVAKDARADAIKFQTFKSELITSSEAERADYQKKNMPNKNETQLKMLKRLELNFASFVKIKRYCDKKGILFLSATADLPSTDFIEPLVPVFKVGSSDLTNYPFLKNLASRRKPIILSTGMSNLNEVEKAVDIIIENQFKYETSFPPLSLLHCTTNYPCPYNEVNLKAIFTLKEAFKLPVGYSDHTLGIEVPVAAVAMGAKIIEKHFTLDKNMEGPDHKASLESEELKIMVKAIRNIEEAIGDGIKKPNKSEIEIMQVARKSIVASKDIKKGDVFTENNVIVKRPGIGISPMKWNEIIGRKASKNFIKDELIEL
ncbi:N-acetylneuraminate synthase [Bacteroidota bacterium]